MTKNSKAVVENHFQTMKKNVELLELKVRRIQAMNALQMLEVEQAVDSLALIDYELSKAPPAVHAAFVPVRDKLIGQWKVDPAKYKDYLKAMEEHMAKQEEGEKPAIEIIPSANTSEA